MLAALLLGTAALAVPAQPVAEAPGAEACAQPALLHVPSPDWRDQVMYFVMTDRFDDGNPRNNNQGQGEFDPTRPSHFSGGDLAGLTRRLAYIQGLGATALWITPPVANRWWDGTRQTTGYHGYWAEHFMQVDAHLGTWADMQRLSRGLHGRGMHLVQDIVLNHVGDYFHHTQPWQATQPGSSFKLNAPDRGRSAPTQWPFSLNDARLPRHRQAGIYHFTPDVADYTQREQELNFQMSGLDDLNSDSPLVRRTLRHSFGHWIKRAGVDAFRLDTAFYMPTAALADFMHTTDPRAPGMVRAARSTGRKNFLVFGEGFGIDRPFDDVQARKIETYMHSAGPVLPSMLNFPLYGSLNEVFARGAPSAVLGHRIESMMALHPRIHWMPSFVDNHDVDRFLRGAGEPALQQALLLLFTLPGIPTLYYGTEQGFTETRASMFATGWGSGGRDHFDTGAPLYRFIQQLTALRRGDKLFSRGRPQVLRSNAAAPGVLAYTMAHAGRRALVVLNSADHEVLVDRLELGSAAGTRWRGRFGLHGVPGDLMLGAASSVTLRLPPRSGQVWLLEPGVAAQAAAEPAPLELHAQGTAPFGGDFTIHGSGAAAAPVHLVVDGDLAHAQTVLPGPGGAWQARIDTAAMVNPSTRHRLVAWQAGGAPGTPALSRALEFSVERPWLPLLDQADPVGDDHGPSGTYRYPSDPGWGANRQLDIHNVRIEGAGGALKIELKMNRVTQSWNPANGFDHVVFTVFIELPGQAGGARVMPLQNAELPAGMRWHVRLRAHGWSNALFGAEGASAQNEGTPLGVAAQLLANPQHGTVTLLLSNAALGRVPNLSGVRVYVSTWDYDAGFRPLRAQPQPFEFGGGLGAQDALVMDDAGPFLLP